MNTLVGCLVGTAFQEVPVVHVVKVRARVHMTVLDPTTASRIEGHMNQVLGIG